MTVNPADAHSTITVRGARVNNLKDLDVDVPKRRLTVFTGVSGSGKSSLVFGTIAAESRRLFDETYSAFIQGFMPSLPRPDVDVLENLSPAIIIDQERMGASIRSTVGTATDANALLRLIFSRLSEPHVGTSGMFSFNLPEGMCPGCEGTGEAATLDESVFLDRTKSLNEGAISAPGFAVGEWYWKTYGEIPQLDPNKAVAEFSAEELEFFLYAPSQKIKVEGKNQTYEGLVTRIRRLWIDRAEPPKAKQIVDFVQRVSTKATCPECGGARLNEAARTATVAGRTIAQCQAMQVSELKEFIEGIDAPQVRPALTSLGGILEAMDQVGLGYLSLDRQAGTLSGGEAQRVKMVRHLGSPLTDVTYVFDEPTAGLHPHDITRMNTLLQQIRDKGNTVLVVEHKPEVIAIADHIVDIGPGAGEAGGTLVYAGDVAGLGASESITARYLTRDVELNTNPAQGKGVLRVGPVSANNLENVEVEVPRGVLSVVTGLAGSGKSTLIELGLAGDPDVLVVDQSAIRGSRRSSPSTYTGLLDKIRSKFAKDNGVKPALFSANSEGACEICGGLGVTYMDLAIMAGVSSPCEACGGKRFKEEVLQYTVSAPKGGGSYNIAEVLDMSVAQAATVFTTGEAAKILRRLQQVGLAYIRLGQPLNTLSGGERQRLKLAAQMNDAASVIVLDEPTTGLHLADTQTIITMLRSLVDAGKTVIAIEHNVAVMAAADHIIDMGPGAGAAGGKVVFQGPPAKLVQADTLTGHALKEAVAAGAAGARV
ncbi:excinuclease ABC subunit UvrA [Corynebacterium sp. 153RC1]|uniref:excinuclease ABC subunit UvrA n=1 Tax=unclassified Corynebacterium TaxID=2624378 RepID=UPI00211C444B|nr:MULTISPECIES: excinuclease ABC subunit UvrA [unclassified Corynebacterium]MCQ9370491.1 excinuclease ABC subunit UvrA [Corynebacterium sp. 35RC1]MCQ9351810.1 excinuclease ABC subunit UvrA [Corynebacterium sp. 209RC1]MCQ9354546.1 excinuclease ABC subunit UvrA [Corynebacterium sp. 1222RC1]MCQ9356092.1 excinuclease ABC subunit UvrA [Corynebacterium sp. 122RC1]MCQ9358724.1 excinuclease ABC subunit UvrA [Corynebacterium sp. 142RC1]